MGGVSHPILFQALWPCLGPIFPSVLAGREDVMETNRGIVVLSLRRSMLSVNGNVQSPSRAARACKSSIPSSCSNTRNRRLCRISALDFQHPSQSSRVMDTFVLALVFDKTIWLAVTSSRFTSFHYRGRKGTDCANYLQRSLPE